jgi:hypothetical protein
VARINTVLDLIFEELEKMIGDVSVQKESAVIINIWMFQYKFSQIIKCVLKQSANCIGSVFTKKLNQGSLLASQKVLRNSLSNRIPYIWIVFATE